MGELQEGKPFCRFYKEGSSPAFSGQEILITETLCKKPEKPITQEIRERPPIGPPVGEPPIKQPAGEKKEVHPKFRVPKGKVSNIMGVMNLLQSKFNSLELELNAKDGAISQQDFEDKIEEAFRQLGIEVDE